MVRIYQVLKFIFGQTISMKKILILTSTLFLFGLTLFGQGKTDKINLKEGQTIKMTTTTKTDMQQAKRGDMKTDMTMVSEFVVKGVSTDGYKIEATVKSAKMNFEGFGMKSEYDSQDPEKQGGQMAQGFKNIIGKAKSLQLSNSGEVADEEEATGGGMMRMMGGGSAATALEGAFVLIPKDIEVGKKWRTTKEEGGLKIITEYTFQGMMSPTMANLTAKQQTKGSVAGGRGGAFTSVINNLTQMTLVVDVTNGLITMKDMTSRDSSSTEMGDETYESTGTTVTSVTCELQ